MRCLLSAALLFTPLPALATKTDAETVVAELGQLNGQVLACGQLEVSKQVRQLMISGVPKTRRYGAIFEEQTNAAFLEQGKVADCQTGKEFAERLGVLARRLQTVSGLEPDNAH